MDQLTYLGFLTIAYSAAFDLGAKYIIFYTCAAATLISIILISNKNEVFERRAEGRFPIAELISANDFCKMFIRILVISPNFSCASFPAYGSGELLVEQNEVLRITTTNVPLATRRQLKC
ncbi:hypothetical protein ACJX0J_023985 [Zea mays]